jgi:hypothetical protein
VGTYVIEVTGLVHVLILTILVIVMFYFQLLSNLSLIVWSCKMCACVLRVSFIPMYNCVTMRIITLLSVICNCLRQIKIWCNYKV